MQQLLAGAELEKKRKKEKKTERKEKPGSIGKELHTKQSTRKKRRNMLESQFSTPLAFSPAGLLIPWICFCQHQTVLSTLGCYYSFSLCLSRFPRNGSPKGGAGNLLRRKYQPLMDPSGLPSRRLRGRWGFRDGGNCRCKLGSSSGTSRGMARNNLRRMDPEGKAVAVGAYLRLIYPGVFHVLRVR